MSACLAEALPQRLDKNFPRARKPIAMLSFCLNTQSRLDEILAKKYPQLVEQSDTLRDVFHLYKIRKSEMDLVDFDDLLIVWHRLLLEHDGGVRWNTGSRGTRFRYYGTIDFRGRCAMEAKSGCSLSVI